MSLDLLKNYFTILGYEILASRIGHTSLDRVFHTGRIYTSLVRTVRKKLRFDFYMRLYLQFEPVPEEHSYFGHS